MLFLNELEISCFADFFVWIFKPIRRGCELLRAKDLSLLLTMMSKNSISGSGSDGGNYGPLGFPASAGTVSSTQMDSLGQCFEDGILEWNFQSMFLYINSSLLRLRFCLVLCTGGAYYVPYSCLLISNKFCNGGSGPSRAN
jgi:hypothetical protein